MKCSCERSVQPDSLATGFTRLPGLIGTKIASLKVTHFVRAIVSPVLEEPWLDDKAFLVTCLSTLNCL